MRYHLTPVRVTISKTTNIKCWWGCGGKRTLMHCWWECKLVQLLYKIVGMFLKRLKLETLYELAKNRTSNSTYGCFFKESKNTNLKQYTHSYRASQVVLVLKNLPANAGDVRNVGLIPGLGRFPGGGHGNPLQYSCRENPIDRGAWWATVHRVAKSQIQLKQLSSAMHSYGHCSLFTIAKI